MLELSNSTANEFDVAANFLGNNLSKQKRSVRKSSSSPLFPLRSLQRRKVGAKSTHKAALTNESLLRVYCCHEAYLVMELQTTLDTLQIHSDGPFTWRQLETTDVVALPIKLANDDPHSRQNLKGCFYVRQVFLVVVSVANCRNSVANCSRRFLEIAAKGRAQMSPPATSRERVLSWQIYFARENMKLLQPGWVGR